MAIDKKAAERQRRYRVREQAKARALFAGATEVEIAWFGLNAEGQHVAIDYDGNAIPLNVIPAAGHTIPSVETKMAPTDKPVKIYAPKSWTPSVWNSNVERIREAAMGRQEVLDWFAESAAKTNTPQAHKQARQGIAVVEALPDTPDWFDHLPLADVS